MKVMIMPSSIDEVKETLDYVDAYLIGIKGFSVNNNLCVNIEDLSKIKEIIGNKELFINLNKNMDNKDIENVKSIMNELNRYAILGIFYYDVGILNIFNSGSFNYDLVWASEHATTNYKTINYWHRFNVRYCLISSDITLSDVLEIRSNTDTKLIVPIFGYQPMFNSKRHIVKNYLDFFDIHDNSEIYYMEKEDKVYPIIDNDEGTSVYTNYILNGIKEYEKLEKNNIDYVLLNSFNIESEKFIDALEKIKTGNYNNNLESDDHTNLLFDNCDSGFMYKETVSKVKKNEK